MRKQKRTLSIFGATALMLLLILDADTARTAATAGIELCIKVIFPSLFPFFVITGYLNNALLGLQIPCSKILRKLLLFPEGCEALLVVGLIGGYPVGAQLVADAYNQKLISKRTSGILLGYCSNAGPAFVFGVAGSLFSSLRIPVYLWMIHLLAALVTGSLLPRPKEVTHIRFEADVCSLSQSVRKSMPICGCVCAWIIIFKIIIKYLDKFLLKTAQPICYTIIMGLLELSNGCLLLHSLDDECLRFVIVSVLLASGGICVTLQTMSVTENTGLGLYIPGKIIQAGISLILSLIICPFLFPDMEVSLFTQGSIILISVCVILLLHRYCKKRCGNLENNHV